MKRLLIFIISFGILSTTYGQKIRTITKERFLTIEEYEVFKSKKKIRNGKYIMKTKHDNSIVVKGQYKENRHTLKSYTIDFNHHHNKITTTKTGS